MPRQLPVLLQVMLLASLAIRMVVGAPCCWSGQTEPQVEQSGTMQHAMHAGHDMAAMGDMAAMPDMQQQPASGHEGHDEGDNRAGPCCSACGPVLASAEVVILAKAAAPHTPREFAERELPPRDLLRLYEATGPPLRV